MHNAYKALFHKDSVAERGTLFYHKIILRQTIIWVRSSRTVINSIKRSNITNGALPPIPIKTEQTSVWDNVTSDKIVRNDFEQPFFENADGHLNIVGHKAIAEAVYEYIDKTQ